MPEAPDLEAYAAYIGRRLQGKRLLAARVLIPPVLKEGRERLADLTGRSLAAVARHGKQLRLDFQGGPLLLVHPMLSGRFQLCHHDEPLRPRTALLLTFEGDCDLRLWDEKLLSRAYVLPGPHALPVGRERAPDVLSPHLTAEELWRRLSGQRASLKSLIVREKVVAGLGNAYADEVLFAAGLSPFRPGGEVDRQEAERLLQAIREVLGEATAQVLTEMERHGLPEDEYRAHLRVHRRGSQPCPRCSAAIQEVTSGGRITSFCPVCQR